MNNYLFIDTWGWLTLNDKRETKHNETVNYYRQYLLQKWHFVTSDYVLDETFTLFFKRLNNHQAKKSMETLLKSFEQDTFILININQQRFYETVKLRNKYLDKPNISFTDLSSIVVMKELKITHILTNDSHFDQVGMELVRLP